MPKKGRRREKEAECEWCFRSKTSWMSQMQEVDLTSRISKGLFQKIPSEQVTRQRVEEGKGGGNSQCMRVTSLPEAGMVCDPDEVGRSP